MKVFVDTNVFLDYIQRRPVGFDSAFSIFKLAAANEFVLIISDLSIANAKYSTRKEISTTEFYEAIKGIRELFTLVPVGASAVDRALALEAKDFEDALQYFSAEQAGADYIVTRNTKDFYFATDVEAIEPREFLSRHFPEEI